VSQPDPNPEIAGDRRKAAPSLQRSLWARSLAALLPPVTPPPGARPYQQMERKDVDDPEVRMITHHLRRNTRQIDTRNYTITFWDLKRILNRFDFDLQNPNNNFIDVVRIDRRKPLFGVHKIERKLIVRIGFPSWTTQVFANTIKTVRNATGLVPANQVDSQMFYNGTDDVRKLIAHYQEPLRHLADR
jgi:hypothetical protein